jgi:hypothetical protein
MPLPDTGTLLVITPLSGSDAFELVPFSALGVTQTLEPIDQSGNLHRSINGAMINLTSTQFRKYHTSITCKNVNAPVLDKAWQGMIVTMECAAKLWMRNGDTVSRPEVSGSGEVVGHFYSYRPILTVMITQIKHSHDEWNADYAWALEAEET